MPTDRVEPIVSTATADENRASASAWVKAWRSGGAAAASAPAPPAASKTAAAPTAIAPPPTSEIVASAAALAAGAPSTAPTVGRDDAWRAKPPSEIRVLVVGSTGYIGKFVTRELIDRGFQVTAVARSASGVGGKKTESDVRGDFPGAAAVRFGGLATEAELDATLAVDDAFDCVVSCLASRTGGVADSWAIDYAASKAAAVVGARRGARHYVLLSAICVQKPLLAFQHAKLRLEAELVAMPGMTYSLVRPTAYFKSVSGQARIHNLLVHP